MSKPSYEELEALVKQQAANISMLGHLQPTQKMISAAQKEFTDYYRNEREAPDEDLIVFLWQAMRGAQNLPVTQQGINSRLTETIPVGWKLVPEQMSLDADAIECICSQCGDGGNNYGNFTDGILWVGEISMNDGMKYGLNISSAEYPEEGAINIYEFDRQLSDQTAPSPVPLSAAITDIISERLRQQSTDGAVCIWLRNKSEPSQEAAAIARQFEQLKSGETE